MGSLVGRIVRARAELFVLTLVVLVYLWLTAHLPEWALWATLFGVIVLVVGVAPVRRYVTRRCWCVLSRHRTRACFRSTWTMTYDGTLPYLLWSRPTPVGERIRVWLPAGLAVNDIEQVSSKLAAACWARECRIEPSRKRAALVVLHIIRRDPLESAQLAPDVLDHIDPATTVDDGRVVPLPRRDAVASEVRQATATQPRAERGQAQKSKNTNNSTGSTPAVEGFGGMDVTDYV
ncbi:hypothetical protein [Amycolatopsis suaedae]|uniref:Uncharacterized protein n=1 Tax=Amycolatopsis suaedae TaxID=2510978 RepID=A0A4Q7J848_9PSEU|nr:hypothetical protein [Amycolatopsis suaedae]RZQ62254.1 hypothetical protein EWH70_18400 [Amycolatopsis suaedae]